MTAICTAPFGQFNAYVLWCYVRHTTIIAAALLSVTLTTDLAQLVWRELTENAGTDWWWLAYLSMRIVAFRGADLTSQIIPICCFLGVLWTEISLTWTSQRLIVWNTGRSPAQCTFPTIVLSTVMIFVQFVFDAHLRPNAVMALERRLEMADGNAVRPSRGRSWFVAGRDLVEARIFAGSPPSLGDVSVYRLDANWRVYEIVTAESVWPTERRNVWQYRNGRIWTSSSKAESEIKEFHVAELGLSLAPLWLAAHGIEPQYLPYRFLKALATTESASYDVTPYRLWFQSRFGRSLLPGAMMLLALSLAMVFFPYRIGIVHVLAAVLAGYAVHVMNGVALVLGEHGLLYPTLASWIVPVLVWAIAGCLLIISQRNWCRRSGAIR